MPLKLTQLFKTPFTRTVICLRCGHRMFHTKRFNWLCGPVCGGAQQWHQIKNAPQIPYAYSIEKEGILDQSMN